MNYNETTSDIQKDLLENMPSGYSKIKGTWLWEMFKAFAIKISELLSLLSDTASKLNIDNLKGDELDAYIKQWTDITRKSAQKARGYIRVKGNGVIYKGTIVGSDTVQFEVTEDVKVQGEADVPIIAVNEGEEGNVEINTITKLITSNAYIESITNESPTEGGTNEETDDAIRDRYYQKLAMPATSGNKAHYIMWATKCSGVGGAKATRDPNIPNKVNVYICNDMGGSADNLIIKRVQDYIDPHKNGDGSGVAPIGAICEIFSAGIKGITISGEVELNNTLSGEDTLKIIKNKLIKYLGDLSFSRTEISYAKLLNVVLSCEGVNDINNFKINGDYKNISCAETDIFSISSFRMEVK